MSIRGRTQRMRQRLRADARKGSAAIEFAMVAPVFFVLLLGIFEGAILFFSQAALQNAVTDMGRLVRTGQTACYTGSGSTCQAMTETQFKQQICDTAGALLPNCATKLVLDMKAYPAGFASVTLSDPLTRDPGGDPAKSTFTATDRFALGSACDVVIARAYYQWPVATPLLTWFLVNMAGGQHLLVGATAFRNEPYTSGVGGC